MTNLDIINQSISPLNVKKVNNQYLTNVDLKINSNIGGINSMLNGEFTHRIPKISMKQKIIIGRDVSNIYPRNKGNYHQVVMDILWKRS